LGEFFKIDPIVSYFLIVGSLRYNERPAAI